PPRGRRGFVGGGRRPAPGWALGLVLASLLVPFAVATVDLFAHCRRRRIGLGPALRALRSRLFFWAYLGAVFYGLGFVGAFPTTDGIAPEPGSQIAGDWPVLPLFPFPALR